MPPESRNVTSPGLGDRATGSPSPINGTFRKEGEYWTVGYGNTAFRLKDTKGFAYLAHLLRHPGTEFHVLDLVGGMAAGGGEEPKLRMPRGDDEHQKAGINITGLGDAGEMLDEQAKSAYRRRLSDLSEELEEAKEQENVERAERVEQEIDALTRELSRAVGLGGRDRRAGSASERARQSIGKSVKTVLERIAQNDAALGDIFSRCIRTGTFCSYQPDPVSPIVWEFAATIAEQQVQPIDDEAKTPRFIETVHGRGYRFVAKVTDEAPAEARRKPPVLARGPKPIVVGREDELARLRSWYSHVLEGQRRVIFVAGEAGIGKTAFVQAFLDSIEQEGTARVGRGQCVEQYGAGEPYMPVLEALSRLGQEPGGERVIELLDRYAPTWLAQMPALLTPEERVRLQSQTQGVTQQRMLREMAQALEALTAESPLVLLLEDLHWSDFSTLELISAIARRSEPARLLIVGTYRPMEMLASDHPLRTMKQELELHRYCEELRLKLLNEEDVAGYLAKRFSTNRSRRFDSLAPAIHERTDGNPLFMVNVVDYLVDAGLLSDEASVVKSVETLRADRFDAPRSIRQMIERNLERLKPEEQMVLEGASVAGAEFSAAAVAAALERPQTEVEACCTRLSRHEQFVTGQGPIAWPDGTVAAGFRFDHALYQEVLYSRLPAGHRVQLHRLIAVREETGYGGRAAEVATELAHHYCNANDKNKAIHYLRLAGERAVGRGAVVEAEGYYRRALELLGELPQAPERDRLELALQMGLGNVFWSSRSWSHPEAGRAFARAQELGEKLGETSQLVAVLSGLLASAMGSGQFKLARELGVQMLVAAERSGDRGSLCAAHTILGQALVWRAQYVDAQKHLELGRNYYDETDRSELGLMGLDASALAAIVLLLLGFPNRARQLMNETLRRSERTNSAFIVGLVHIRGGMFCGLLRDARAALEHAQELRRLAANQPVWTGLADMDTGKALMIQGEWEDGVNYLRKGIAFHKAVGLAAQPMWAELYEVEFFANQGQIDDGLTLIAKALADSEELAQIRSPALRLRADLLAQSNAEASTIDAAYRAAIECARSQGARYYELQATTPLARWLKSQGRAAEAQTLLAEIYGWFTEGFDTPALNEAKALLDELSA